MTTAGRFAVIGGGVGGAAAAYRLARGGHDVTLIDRGDPGQATAAGAGIISPGSSNHAGGVMGGPFYSIAQEAGRFYPHLVAQLAEDGAGDTGYETVGQLVIARDETEVADLEQRLQDIRTRQAHGMPNIGEASMISPGEAVELFPPLAPPAAAIHLRDAARVDGRLLRDALRRGLEHHGGRLIVGNAIPEVTGDRVTSVRVNGERIAVDGIVLSPGTWANELTEALGFRVPIAPQRGQIFHLRVPGANTSRWPNVTGRFDHYLLAFGPDRVVAGATRETGSGFDPRLTAGGVVHALSNALGIAPGLATATLHEPRVGLRPYTADRLPILGRAPGLANVTMAMGFGPSGLLLGPWSGAMVADLLTGDAALPGAIDLQPYRWDRPLQSEDAR
ncbi:MAG TPA: FAD-dependent oxidoreductase [Thermomicrobiales bacterium]|jgi:D-amino-acid dehydrogenase|nr:FAD-dependent oxidoreductase [Thermomicrobiales bacterium]